MENEVLATDLAMWNLIAGFFLPIVLSMIIQSGWSKAAKAVVAFIAMLGISVVTTALEDKLDFANWVTSALIVLVATIGSYQALWKPTGVADTVEEKTNLSGGNG